MQEGVPEVLSEPGGCVDTVLRVLQALFCMVSRIMAETITKEDLDEIEQYIKIF